MRNTLRGKAVGGGRGAGASRPYRVSQGDEVDAASAQFYPGTLGWLDSLGSSCFPLVGV